MKVDEIVLVGEAIADAVKAWDSERVEPSRIELKAQAGRIKELTEENVRLDRQIRQIFQMFKDLPTPKDGEPGRDGIDGKDGADGKDGEAGKDGRDGIDGKDGAPGRDGIDGKDGRDGIDGKDGAPGPEGQKGLDGRDGEPGPAGSPGEPGPQGEKGMDGRDGRDGLPGIQGEKGLDGRDGVDGLGFDDLSAEFDGLRKLTLVFTKGDRVKRFDIELPTVIDQGVYKDGETYAKADGVTHGGSFWIAQRKTDQRPGEGDDWRLAVKRGRDGKDLPMVKVKDFGSVKINKP